MRQRVMIAMALACNPKLLIADEPTTALDVTIQAQILDLMRDLKTRLGSAIMLITHDLGVVAEMAQRVVVMYAGRKVEEAAWVGDIFARPLHPYTKGLLGRGAQARLLAGRGAAGAAGSRKSPARCRACAARSSAAPSPAAVRWCATICREIAPGDRAEGARPFRSPATSPKPPPSRRKPRESAETSRGEHAEEALPGARRFFRRPDRQGARGRRRQLRPSPAARRCPWSARAAAASRRSGAPSCG